MKLDRRAKYTRDTLKDSLIELMKDQPIQKITVKALCEKADINRATFYGHYKNIESLLSEIENDFYTAVNDVFAGSTNIQYDIYSILVNILNRIKQQRELCTVLVSPYGNKNFLESLLNMVYERAVVHMEQRFPHAKRIQLERTYGFFAHGSVNIIVNWIQTGLVEPPEEIATFIIGLMEEGLRSFRKTRFENTAFR